MKAVLLIHFGSPKDERQIGPFIRGIFCDKKFSAFGGKLSSFIMPKIVLPFAKMASKKRYALINYSQIYTDSLESFSRRLGGALGGSYKIFTAARYGEPSIKSVFEEIAESDCERIVGLPLFPHASVEMYDSIVDEVFANAHSHKEIKISWTAPFGGMLAFTRAWVDSIRTSLSEFSSDEQKTAHILFSAHSIPIKKHDDWNYHNYPHQVEESAKLIADELKKDFSVAYQSQAPIGHWLTPSIKDELKRLASKGVANCVIVPISFLFDNIETLVDIQKIAIPFAIKTGMRKVIEAAPCGNADGIISLFVEMVNRSL